MKLERQQMKMVGQRYLEAKLPTHSRSTTTDCIRKKMGYLSVTPASGFVVLVSCLPHHLTVAASACQRQVVIVNLAPISIRSQHGEESSRRLGTCLKNGSTADAGGWMDGYRQTQIDLLTAM